MNSIIVGGFAFILGLVLWTVGKKTNKGLVATKEINHRSPEEISLLVATKKGNQPSPNEEPQAKWKKPNTLKEKIKLQKKLLRLMSSSPEDRLLAINLAIQWNNPRIRPLLIRGLKDFDSRIVIAAANALNKKRLEKKSQTKSRPPRNIFLMR